jgi:hypothetical protein
MNNPYSDSYEPVAQSFYTAHQSMRKKRSPCKRSSPVKGMPKNTEIRSIERHMNKLKKQYVQSPMSTPRSPASPEKFKFGFTSRERGSADERVSITKLRGAFRENRKQSDYSTVRPNLTLGRFSSSLPTSPCSKTPKQQTLKVKPAAQDRKPL